MKRRFGAVLGLGLALAAVPLVTAVLTGRSHEALVADPGNWVNYGRTYDENHFSPLDQVNAGNVGRLGLAWAYDIETVPSVFTAPLAVDGVLYFSVGYSIIHAVDARNGKLLWKYDPEVWKAAGRKLRAGWGVRGIAFKDGKVFTATLDGRLLALDAKTGRPLWSVKTIADPNDALYITGPPWVFNDKVVIGNGGAEYGPVRGYVTAYNIDTGKQAWRFYTVPGDPSKGPDGAASDAVMPMAAKTWTGEWWKHGGGGTVWNAMAYDAKFNRLYIGGGNGAPWNQKVRSPGGGDNLFLSSIIALDADTGRYVWHYQQNPGESWDFNPAMDFELADLTIGGRKRPVLMQAPKNGFFYVIDRTNGKLISAEKFAKVTWAERIDLATGRPVENSQARYPDGQPALVFPGAVGAHGAHAMAFSPATGLAYIPVTEMGRVYVDPAGDLKTWRHPPGLVVATANGDAPADLVAPPPASALVAWDPVRQRAAWKVDFPGMHQGGVLATGGNLIFQGRGTGELAAYAADSGRKLWSFDSQVGVQAQPITYTAGGKQYVTVIAGWRASGVNGDGKVWDYRTQRRRVLTFALDAGGRLPPPDATMPPILDDPAFKVDPAKAERGVTLYMGHCMICHGAGATAGGAAPDLRTAGVPMSLEAMTVVVQGGGLQQQGMPRFEELTQQDLLALQHFIRRQARAALAADPALRTQAVTKDIIH